MAPPSSGFYPIMIVFLPSATKLRKGNVFTHVCHSVHGDVSAQGWYLPGGRGQTPPGHTPPWAYTPTAQCMVGYTPPAQCMLGYTPPCPVHAGIYTPQCMLGYTPAQCTLGYTPPAQCMLGYGQQAGGTHPTGMHSSFFNNYGLKQYFVLNQDIDETLGRLENSIYIGFGSQN